MAEIVVPHPLRAMTADDVPAVLDVQEPGSVRSLAKVFPQDAHPFPRADIGRRWRREIATPGTDCFVVLLDDTIVGFAAIRGEEFLHFGIAVRCWGSGIARTAHDAVLDMMRRRGVRAAGLWVFTGNGRARRFYEKLGWHPTGQRSRSSFAPNPELLHYARAL